MPSRRESRRHAVQAMYAYGVEPRPIESLLAGLSGIIEDSEWADDEFGRQLCVDTCERLERIDAELAAVVEHWRPERVSAIDRAILRLATCEILFISSIPSRVTLNEYIELAKSMGDDPSPAFVNGVLDRVVARANDPAAESGSSGDAHAEDREQPSSRSDEKTN